MFMKGKSLHSQREEPLRVKPRAEVSRSQRPCQPSEPLQDASDPEFLKQGVVEQLCPWQGWFRGGLACVGTVRKTESEGVRECVNTEVIRERQKEKGCLLLQ